LNYKINYVINLSDTTSLLNNCHHFWFTLCYCDTTMLLLYVFTLKY